MSGETGFRAASLLDLFAGSGSVGIEALSRGAQKVVFVDNSSEAIKTIKENLSNCRFEKMIIPFTAAMY